MHKGLLKTVYVERLTLPWMAAQMGKFFRRPAMRVVFLDHGPAALLLARVLSLAAGVSFRPLDFRYAEMRDKHGINIQLKNRYDGLARLADLVLRDIPATVQKEKALSLYLTKAPVCSVDIYGDDKYGFLRNAAMHIDVVRWHAGPCEKTGDCEFYVFERPFLGPLAQYARSQGILIHSMGTYKSWGSRAGKIFRKIAKLNMKVIMSLAQNFWSGILASRPLASRHPFTGEDMLLVESRVELNLTYPERVSDLFFLNEPQGIKAKDAVLMFNGTFNPLTEPQYKLMQGHGVLAVALTPQSSQVPPSKVPIFKNVPGKAGPALRPELTGDSLKLAGSYEKTFDYWQKFFQEYHIKLWTSFYKNEAESIAMFDALKSVGGISSIYQRSYEGNPSIITAVGTDIVFSFSKQEYGLEIANGSRFGYHVATGFLGDHRFNHLKPIASALRQRLIQAGAKHIVAYFDENSISDGRWYFGHGDVQKNYAFWLEKVLADPALGLVLKPKLPGTLRRRLGAVSRLLTKAEATGRCFVFEGGLPQSAYPPSAASLAADIAIQESLYAGTAGLESALSGTRTLLMDLEGWPVSPLYRLGPEVVFKDWDSAYEACSAYFQNPSSRPKLGDWSAMVHELDPFRDGRAAERMSWYLKELLEGLRRLEDRSTLMERVADQYAKRWGKDKVQRGTGA